MSAIDISEYAPATTRFAGRRHEDLAAEDVLMIVQAKQTVSNPVETSLTLVRIKGQKAQSRSASHLVVEVVLWSPSMLDRLGPHARRAEACPLKKSGHLLRAVAASAGIYTRTHPNTASAETGVVAGTPNLGVIAVLPFVTLGADSGNAYLATGLTNAVAGKLMKTEGVRVLAPVVRAQ